MFRATEEIPSKLYVFLDFNAFFIFLLKAKYNENITILFIPAKFTKCYIQTMVLIK